MCASRPHPQGHAAVDGHPESETVCPGPVRGLPAVPREHPVALAAEVARPPLIQIHYGLPLPRLEGHLITARISPCSRSQSMSVVATHRVRKPSCQSRSQRQSATGRTPQSHVSSPARRRCGINPPSACSRSSSPPPSARRGPSGGACRPTRARTRIPSSPARTPGCGRKRVLQALWSLARARRGCRAPRRTAGRGSPEQPPKQKREPQTADDAAQPSGPHRVTVQPINRTHSRSSPRRSARIASSTFTRASAFSARATASLRSITRSC